MYFFICCICTGICKRKMAKDSDVIPLNGDGMDIDDDEFDDDEDDEMAAIDAISDLGEPFLRDFTRKAATAFFDQYGLISHQINSFNDFIPKWNPAGL